MRHAMSMIELVFAIVIMGIAVMSLPLILTQVQNNNAFAMQQEAILAAKAKIGEILTYEWDGESFDTNASRSFVLDTINVTSDPELRRVGTTAQRFGHVNANYRRKFSPTNPTAPSSTGEIDMFNGQPTTIAASLEEAGTLDYVFTLTLTPTITYAKDSANYTISPLNDFELDFDNVNAITNIKTISVQVTGSDQNITLRTFTCNIGESTLLPSRPYR